MIVYKGYNYKLLQSKINTIACSLCDLENRKILDKDPCRKYGGECIKTNPMSYWVKKEKVTNNDTNKTDYNCQLSLF